MFSERNLHGDQPARRILRFGQRISGQLLPTVPQRARGVDDGDMGRLNGARLDARGREVWLRLTSGGINRAVRTIPVNTTQTPAPTPDALELRGGMRVRCHEGGVGRLAGMVIETREGLVSDLIIRVRSDAMADVSLSSDPMFKLVEAQGQLVMISPAWALSVSHTPTLSPFASAGLILELNATVEQVASGAQLRTDGQLTAAAWEILNQNPAIAPYQGRLRVQVRDGDVTLLGTLPSPRHRASAEQDVWHLPGVLSVHNEITIG